MFEIIKKALSFPSLENRVSLVLELEKSISDNKLQAEELAGEYLPLIKRLGLHVNTLEIASTLEKSEFKQVEYISLLDKHVDKLKLAEDEYYTKLGKLTRINKSLEPKLGRLMEKSGVKDAITLIKHKSGLEDAFGVINDNFDKGLVPLELYSKSFVNFAYQFSDSRPADIGNVPGYEMIFKSFYDGDMALDFFEKAVKVAQEKKVSKVMKEFKDGTLKTGTGDKVTSKDQAIAIAMSEAGLSKAEAVKPVKEEEPVEKSEAADEKPTYDELLKSVTSLKEELTLLKAGNDAGKTIEKSEEINWMEKPVNEILKGFKDDLLNEEQLERILIDKTGNKDILKTVLNGKD